VGRERPDPRRSEEQRPTIPTATLPLKIINYQRYDQINNNNEQFPFQTIQAIPFKLPFRRIVIVIAFSFEFRDSVRERVATAVAVATIEPITSATGKIIVNCSCVDWLLFYCLFPKKQKPTKRPQDNNSVELLSECFFSSSTYPLGPSLVHSV